MERSTQPQLANVSFICSFVVSLSIISAFHYGTKHKCQHLMSCLANSVNSMKSVSESEFKRDPDIIPSYVSFSARFSTKFNDSSNIEYGNQQERMVLAGIPGRSARRPRRQPTGQIRTKGGKPHNDRLLLLQSLTFMFHDICYLTGWKS